MDDSDPVLSIAKSIEDTKKQSDQNPQADVKEKLQRLRKQLYRLTGGPG